MLRRGVTLLHTLVILFAGMIAAGGVAAFASFSYRTAAEQEMSVKAQLILEGAVEQAKWEVWNQDLAVDDKADYAVDGATVSVDVTGTNTVAASTWNCQAVVNLEGRSYTLNRTIGLPRFPADRVNWVYNPNNQHHYAIITVTAGMDFSTALANAKELTAPDGKKGYLATITSSTEWTWIKQKMLPSLGTKSALTGAKQPNGSTEPSGGWAWSNSEPWNYSDWQTGEPNNGSTGESLMAVNVGGVQKFFDVADVPGYKTFLVEAGNWVSWMKDWKTGHSYTYVAAPNLTWSQARDQAAAIGGPNGEPTYLLSVTTSAEQAYIKGTLLAAFTNPNGGWIGAYQDAGSSEPSTGWKWASGEPWRYSDWQSGEPNNTVNGAQDEDAGQMYSTGTWNDIWPNCQGITTIPGYWVEAGAPLNWQYNATTGRWYAVMPVEGGMTWTEANTWAQELSGPNDKQAYLASVTSAQEHSFISGLVDAAKAADGSELWADWGWAKAGPYVGARQISFTNEPAGGWVHTSGEGLDYSGVWSAGQPDNSNGTEHFAHMVKVNGQWLWNDGPDDVWVKGFVVEAGDPPYVWKQWTKASGGNDNWYCFVSVPAALTWDQSNTLAKGMTAPNGKSGYLVTFTSAAEMAWVQSSLVPASPIITTPHNGLSWFGARQEPGSQENKMGWVYDNGETLISYWGGWNFQVQTSEPNDGGSYTGGVSDWATREDAGLLYLNSGVLGMGNYWPNSGYGVRGVIVEAGQPSQMKMLETRWKTSGDSSPAPHPDSTKSPFVASDITSSLGSYELPVISSSGITRGISDIDSASKELQVFVPGNRGGNTQVFMESEGPVSLPLDSNTNEDTGFTALGTTGGRRQQHFKGTFYLADAAAVNSVAISMTDVDDAGVVYINGTMAFGEGQSLTNRTLLKVGDNRIDVFFLNYGGAGTNNLSISVPVRPYAKPISLVHPAQFGLAVQTSITTASSPNLKVEGNAYLGVSTLPSGFASASSVEGFLYTTSSGALSNLTPEYRVSGSSALTWPSYTTSSWHAAATTSYSSGSTITSPTFSTSGTMLSSSGTLNVAGIYSGRGVIHADTVIVTGHLRPAAPDSALTIIAREVRFGLSGTGDHYIDAVVMADDAVVNRPTILTGSLAAKTLTMTSGANSALTIRQREAVWRSKALGKELKLPGYWTPSSLTGTYFIYPGSGQATPMLDVTPAGTSVAVPWTLGGRLNSNYRPLASPVGRTWYKPTIQMKETTYPGTQLNWWTATGTRILQEKVQVDSLPFNYGTPFWPDAYQSGTHTRGVWWTGSFTMASAADITALTMSIGASDDMAAVYINGRLALDHGGKKDLSLVGPSLADKSMIAVGTNRIDIYFADICEDGGFSFTSNTTFSPNPVSISGFTTTDNAYNAGLYILNAFNMTANLTLYGDLLMYSDLWSRSSGTQVIYGMTRTPDATLPSGVTYGDYTASGVTAASLPSFPALPAATVYSGKAQTVLTSGTLAPQTNSTGSPKLYYRDGNLAISGTANWSGRITVVASGEISVTGALNVTGSDTKVTLISYGNCLINPSGATVNATILCNNQATIQSTTTIRGGLITKFISQSYPLTIYQDGHLYYNPENWTKSYLPGYIP